MTGLAALAVGLHESRSDAARLKRDAANLDTLSRAVLAELAHDREQLRNANDDKRVLHRFLDAAGEAEEDLKDDLGDLRQQHAETLLTHDRETQAWSNHDAQLQTSLAAEAGQREEAEQKASQFEAETVRLANEATQWQQCVQDLRTEREAMRREICEQGSRISALQRENSSLSSCNAQLQSEVGCLRSEIGSLRSTICSLEGRIACLQGELARAQGRK